MKYSGGPAFPCPGDSNGFDGMTLRDWFAGQALAGLMADSKVNRLGKTPGWPTDYDEFKKQVARSAYDQADAMLAARV